MLARRAFGKLALAVPAANMLGTSVLPQGSTRVAEIGKCLQYCKDAPAYGAR